MTKHKIAFIQSHHSHLHMNLLGMITTVSLHRIQVGSPGHAPPPKRFEKRKQKYCYGSTNYNKSMHCQEYVIFKSLWSLMLSIIKVLQISSTAVYNFKKFSRGSKPPDPFTNNRVYRCREGSNTRKGGGKRWRGNMMQGRQWGEGGAKRWEGRNKEGKIGKERKVPPISIIERPEL